MMGFALTGAAPAAEPESEPDRLEAECARLGIPLRIRAVGHGRVEALGPSGEALSIGLADPLTPVEQVLRGLRFDFAGLPLLTRGESKEIRLLTPQVALAKLLPTVYSFTNNRYGVAAGTEIVRAQFSARLFRMMAREAPSRRPATAFLGLIEDRSGPLLAERVVRPGNIEVRVKRYHIGSPVHRYRYSERHEGARGAPPVTRWTRFERPVVCFDWRHPLEDEAGTKLADEPLPDDYAALWIDDIGEAKRLAGATFEWIEGLFASKGLKLIDICFFIDSSGREIFGEISPDCMRVRRSAADDAEALDKDEWRAGGDADAVLDRYQRLYDGIFGVPLPTPEA